MKMLILIGGLVVVGLIAVGVYTIVMRFEEPKKTITETKKENKDA